MSFRKSPKNRRPHEQFAKSDRRLQVHATDPEHPVALPKGGQGGPVPHQKFSGPCAGPLKLIRPLSSYVRQKTEKFTLHCM
jgi:hypothetical protein